MNNEYKNYLQNNYNKMIRRFFSSIKNEVKKSDCSNCRLYNRTNKLCKLNNLLASENRTINGACGIDGTKYFPLDKKNLYVSNMYLACSISYTMFGIGYLFPYMIFHDFSIMMAIFSGSTIVIGNMYSLIAMDYKKKYLEDNNITNADDL